MTPIHVSILGGLAAGIAIAVQASLAGILGRQAGVVGSAFIVHGSGALVAGLLLLLLRDRVMMSGALTIPWYAYSVGALGVMIMSAISYAIPRLGSAGTIALLIVTQLVVGIILDHMGWIGQPVRPVDLSRALGVALLLAGAWLVVG